MHPDHKDLHAHAKTVNLASEPHALKVQVHPERTRIVRDRSHVPTARLSTRFLRHLLTTTNTEPLGARISFVDGARNRCRFIPLPAPV
jgi:uncharacterized protein YwbE